MDENHDQLAGAPEPAGDRAEATDGPLAIRADLGGKVSLAQQQNDFPLLHGLEIENLGEEPLVELSVEISADPPFLAGRKWLFDRLEPGEVVGVRDLDVGLTRSYLAGLEEAVRATVTIEAANGQGRQGSWTRPVKVLATEEWGGLSHLPDLTAAFCRPNDPAVEKVLKRAARILSGAGMGSQLNGYQTKDRNQVWRQLSAIYAAMCSMGLDYATPPASFEQEGQRIRSPRRVLESGLGTCLDLALFLAACFEQAGLNPLIVLTRGHAFPGCWLVDTDFSSIVIDDCQSLRKRRQLGELLLVESVAVTRQPAPAFNAAVEQGARHLEVDENFECALDISRARMNHISPLTDRDQTPDGAGPEEADEPGAMPGVEDAPVLPNIDYLPEGKDVAPETPDSRVEQWKRKLLDLTLRNKLLNFKPTRMTIPIICPDPDRLEDLLSAEKKLKFVAMPIIMEGDDPRSKELHQARTGSDPKEEYARQALGKRDILADLPPKEMEDRLVGLYRLARREMEEGGANTLYLAMGMLQWTQAGHSSRVLRAPLLLLPVQLERSSVRAGFKLRLHDDDPCLNPTLLEMLHKDFRLDMPTLENELPQDESGLDVAAIWQTVRRHVRDQKGWEVTKEIYLGTFSFTKYLMWKDLQDRLGQLKENPVVRHLIETPREQYRGEGEFPERTRLDDQYPPQNVFCPLSADSSQLAAVLAAAQGKDFVVVGPPGTGKSQTITNMIVQCLVEGKTVLFVSEKMAALDVVYRRLRQVGVGAYCLEMHSSKARKLDVLKQLKAAWNSREAFDDGQWLDNASRLGQLRARLNRYPQRLHKVYPNGFTPYEALGVLIAEKDQPGPSFSWSGPLVHSRDDWNEMNDAAARLAINAAEVGGLSQHPLRGVWQEEWSPGWQRDLLAKAGDLSAGAGELREALREFRQGLGLPTPGGNGEQIRAVCDLAQLLPQAAGQSYAFAFAPQARSTVEQLTLIAEHGREIERLHGQLVAEYLPEATSLDLDRLTGQWREANEAWWPKSFFRRRAVAKQLKPHTPAKKPPDREHMAEDLATLGRIKEQEEAIDGLADTGQLLGTAWRGLQTDWDQVEAAGQFAQEAAVILGRLGGGDLDQLSTLRGRLERLLEEGDILLAEGGAVRAKGERLLAAHDRFAAHLAAAGRAAQNGDESGLADPSSPQWLDRLEAVMRAWREHDTKLHAWCMWRKARSRAVELGLDPLVGCLERGEIEPDQVEKAFEVGYFRWWLDEVVDADEVLKSFHSVEREQYIHKFWELDDKILQLTSGMAKARISGSIPSQVEGGNRKDTEWGVLNREITKKRRHMPLRKLIDMLPHALTKLTPCLLMSPLSVAQYLSPGTALFDVVIFDEASQIPVWDAIGALARGKQAIVVGDPKQLPPTNFFARGDDDEEVAEWEVEDLESILDECQGANLPDLYLRWHYRSRHESLILFSNQKYYHGQLVTFPSAVTCDDAVKYCHVPDGRYEKGKSRINREEAREVVRAALGWLRDPEFVDNDWSLGIVTFNQQQQMFIEDLLDEERRQDPRLEHHFNPARIEPVFVKNLENVQGDERDVILFSVTYGPDAAGKVSMNFGPLNKQGGERRLNVAITRARRSLQVFGTLKGEHIDLSRTKAEGVRDLKHFLEFAEKGPRALAEMVDPALGGYDSRFEREVAEELRRRGWRVQSQVGVSGFRVDLGVVHPQAAGRYLAGVECDGATYHRSATARDRDRLRESVLRGLGWNIVRVWSTDWWVDRAASAQKLDERLQEILRTDKAQQQKTQNERKARAVIQEKARRELPEDESPAEPEDRAVARPAPAARPAPPAPAEPYASAPAEPTPPSIEAKQESYRVADPVSVLPKEVRLVMQSEDFYQTAHNTRIKDMINEVVKVEGPVALELVISRVCKVYGFKRAGSKIKSRIKRLAKDWPQRSNENGQVFLWPHGCNPASWPGFRVNPDGEGALRPVELICPRELKNLASYVQEVDCPLDERGLLKGIAERLGYSKLTQKTEKAIKSALGRKSKP